MDLPTADNYICRECCMLHAQLNILLSKFCVCTNNVKLSLFRAYCTPLYSAHVWSNDSKATLQKLQVAYNDTLGLFLV